MPKFNEMRVSEAPQFFGCSNQQMEHGMNTRALFGDFMWKKQNKDSASMLRRGKMVTR